MLLGNHWTTTTGDVQAAAWWRTLVIALQMMGRVTAVHPRSKANE